MMTSQELSRLIEEELRSADPLMKWHGRPLRECLLPPQRQCFLNSHNDNEPEQLWLVFEEGPTPGAGYKVVYDEELNQFGLAVAGVPSPVLIGLYGNFLETLNSM